jgi:hypothetical protein
LRLIQNHPGHNWHTDDPAMLYMRNTGHLAEPPQTLNCFVLHDSLNGGEFIEIELERLEFIASAMFGEARPSGGSTKWTGDAYRHAIYRYTRPYSSYGAIVIIETHGGGTQGYYIRTLTAVETWSHLAATLTSELLWNVCHDMCRMYDNARYVERHRIYAQFLQGRLKKRRRGGRVSVQVLPETEQSGSKQLAISL